MDAIGRLKKLNNKGIAVVYLALMIVVLVAFVGLAVDIGYMYVAKGQLQNASDSGALAGAAKLDKTNSTTQSDARLAATTFANTNTVVPSGTKVIISNDGTNALAPGNDITVGNWDATKDPKYLEGRIPINAVQARARRSSDSPGGAVDIFFARVMGWETMNTSAAAVAAMIARATTYLAVCQNFCSVAPGGTEHIFSSPRVMETGTESNPPPDGTPSENLFAWSSITERPSGPGINLNDIICNDSPNVEACGYPIYTTMGGDTTTMRKMESVMYNPNFDADHKDIDSNGKVVGWTVIVPVTRLCPPGAQGIGVGLDPKEVWGYVQMHISAICVPGGGPGCSGSTGYSAPMSVCSSYPGKKVIIIDKITCVTCDNSGLLEGLKPALVE
jgi:hypothetical protein